MDMIVSGRGLPVVQPADPAGFEAWIAPHWNSMLRLATRLAGRDEAEDVVQDAVSSAWRKRAQFDAARGTPQAWLLAIVADQAAKTRRRRRDTTELDDYPVVDTPTPDPDLARAVAGLSARQRIAVELYYYLGLPISEVAAVMGRAEGTVKATLAAARTRLREELEDHS